MSGMQKNLVIVLIGTYKGHSFIIKGGSYSTFEVKKNHCFKLSSEILYVVHLHSELPFGTVTCVRYDQVPI